MTIVVGEPFLIFKRINSNKPVAVFFLVPNVLDHICCGYVFSITFMVSYMNCVVLNINTRAHTNTLIERPKCVILPIHIVAVVLHVELQREPTEMSAIIEMSNSVLK